MSFAKTRRSFLEQWGLSGLKISLGFLEGEFNPHDPDRAAASVLQLVRTCKDNSAEANAQCLLGDVLRNQGQFDAAMGAYSKGLRILHRLADFDPGNASWQHDLAVSLANIGIICQKSNETGRAQNALNESANILLRLTELDPSNAVWRQDLATVRSWLEKP